MTLMEFFKLDTKEKLALLKKRAWGPVGSVVVHIFAVAILLSCMGGTPEMVAPPVEAIVMETKADTLEEVTPEVKHELEQEPITEPVDMPEHEIRNNAEYSATEEISDIPDPGRGRGLGTGTGTGVGDGDQAGFQISGAKSPLIMKGLYGSRGSGGRGRALSKYGGGGATEGAVLRALRWLKKEQKSDGSWDSPAPAMTGLALLCYLAHGETPASDEFGPTVERAIKYLIESQDAGGRFKGSDGHEYSLPIAAYALSEAYGMTKVPMIKAAAEKAIEIIIRGQHASGGWNYKCGPEDRDDTSYMGWCAQALKAASMAGLENEGLKPAMRKAIDGFKKNSAPSGGFGYTGPGGGGLTGVGVLCMQLLGAAKEPEVRMGLTAMDPWIEQFEGAVPGGASIYYWYYATQAKFHAGGDTWNNWNKQFSKELVKQQIVIKGGGVDGKDIGYWDPPKGINSHSTGLVFNTTLCCLQLEVYYRYLPTYKPPEEIQPEAAPAAASSDVNIEIK